VGKILLVDMQSSTRFTCKIARAVKAPLWCHELKEFRKWLATLACRWQNICTFSFSKLIVTFGLHTHIHELSIVTHLTHAEKVEADVRFHKSEDTILSSQSLATQSRQETKIRELTFLLLLLSLLLWIRISHVTIEGGRRA
jgi:hypothetical protein